MKKDVSFFEVYGKVNYTSTTTARSASTNTTTAELPELRCLGQLHVDHRQGIAPTALRFVAASACTSRVSSVVSGSAPPIPSTARSRSRTASSTPTTTPGIRHRLHLQGVHAGPALLRHQSSKGDCNAFTSDSRPAARPSPAPPSPRSIRRRWLQLVRRGGHSQAVVRPDRDDQPEVSFFTEAT